MVFLHASFGDVPAHDTFVLVLYIAMGAIEQPEDVLSVLGGCVLGWIFLRYAGFFSEESYIESFGTFGN